MALILNITSQYSLADKGFKISEVISSGNSWGEADNPERTDIDKAVISVFKENKFFLDTDVTTLMVDGTLTDVILFENKILEDGVYYVYLEVELQNGDTYTSEMQVNLVDNDIKAYLCKFWAKYAATTSSERKKGIEDVCFKLEAIYSGLQALCEIKYTAEASELIRILQSTINLNKNYLH